MITINSSQFDKLVENFSQLNSIDSENVKEFYEWLTSIGCTITVYEIPNWNYIKETWCLKYTLKFNDPEKELFFRLKYL